MHLGVLIGDLGPVVKVCNGSGRPKAVRGHTDAYRIKDHVWSLAAVGERIDRIRARAYGVVVREEQPPAP